MDEPGPNAMLFQWVHTDVKQRMDALLGALGMRGLVKEASKTMDFVKNTIAIYETVPNGSGNKTQVLGLLDNILSEVTELEHLLTRHLKYNS
jgi:hypothetical protein